VAQHLLPVRSPVRFIVTGENGRESQYANGRGSPYLIADTDFVVPGRQLKVCKVDCGQAIAGLKHELVVHVYGYVSGLGSGVAERWLGAD